MIKKETLNNILLFFCLMVIFLFGFNLIKISSEYHKATITINQLQEQIQDLSFELYTYKENQND